MGDYSTTWQYVREAVPDLEEYILSPELYWPLSIGRWQTTQGPLTRLSPGGLLYSIRLLTGLPLSIQEQTDLQQVSDKIFSIRNQWKANWGKKCTIEFQDRLKVWENGLNEILAQKTVQESDYAVQARQRVILELLKPDLYPPDENLENHLTAIDRSLKTRAQKSQFVWNNDIEKAFPQDPFWYLYVSLGGE